MIIDGYQVVCYGVRIKNGVNNYHPLKKVCRDCGLFVKSSIHPLKPSWRAMGFVAPGKHTCKIKELWKAKKMT